MLSVLVDTRGHVLHVIARIAHALVEFGAQGRLSRHGAGIRVGRDLDVVETRRLGMSGYVHDYVSVLEYIASETAAHEDARWTLIVPCFGRGRGRGRQ